MFTKEALIALRTALVELYPETNDARGVARDAGLNTGRIDFTGKIVNVWRSVLEEAEKSDKLGAVLQAIRLDYPQHAGLQQMATTLGSGDPVHNAFMPPDKSTGNTYNISIQHGQGIAIGDGTQVTQSGGTQTNTGGGSYVEGNVEAGQDFVGRDQTPGPVQPTTP